MFHDLKKTFLRITPEEVARRELAEAEMAKLAAHSAHEYASSLINYRDAQIKRLRKFLSADTSGSISAS